MPALKPEIFDDHFAFVKLPGRGVVSVLTLVNGMMLRHLDSPGAVRLLCIDFTKAYSEA